MKENKTIQYRIQIGNDLLAYLHPESGEKYSKMAAFRHLVELATGDKKEFPAIAKPLPEGQVALTVSGLAKHWNWAPHYGEEVSHRIGGIGCGQSHWP